MELETYAILIQMLNQLAFKVNVARRVFQDSPYKVHLVKLQAVVVVEEGELLDSKLFLIKI